MITQAQALHLCFNTQKRLQHLKVFVGLTGGCLYKEGNRKDVDLIIYGKNSDKENTNPVDVVDIRDQIIDTLEEAGWYFDYHNTWLSQARYEDVDVDLFFMQRVEDKNFTGDGY